jgi:cadmium resistance protein CadD (predicted permease)
VLQWLHPQVARVAAVTGANGSDNIAVNTALFVAGGAPQMMIIIAIFLVMVWIWCWVADWLAENPVTAGPLRRHGELLVLFVLTRIGLTILVESGGVELALF